MQENGKLPKRSEVPVESTWRLEDIYETQEAWEADLSAIEACGEKIRTYEGRVTESAKTLLEIYDRMEQCSLVLDKVYGYAHMKHDQDTADADAQVLYQRAMSVYVRLSESVSFIDPEVLTLSEEQYAKYLEEEPGLKKYENSFRETFRGRAHTLSPESERLIASTGEMAATPQNAYGMLSNADLKFPSVTDREGNEIQISNGRFVPLQMNPDRELRREVFEKYYGRYKEFVNTWAALYDGEVKSLIFRARARKYGSTFEAAVDRNNVSPEVCDRLFESVHRNMDKMHRYVSLRKKALGVDELHMYDVYMPIVKDHEYHVTYEEAKEIALEALKPLGEEYLSVVQRAFAERWIDVPENEGKRGGAYSSDVYGVHPYMLLNFNGTLDDIFTLVHEMGHSMHSWYSDKNQTYDNAQYKIFVAEVASTTNEVLLLEYLLSKADSAESKAYLINHYLDSFKGTVYRQTMFEEFERRSHAMAEQGTPLTADSLSELYLNLNREYFGEEMISDPEIAYEWCRIPHFYYNFYVYQYATSYCAAVAIAHRILEEGEGGQSVRDYLKFLSSGCTSDPVSLLKIAGVDLSTAEPMDEALKVFGNAVEEMEKLLEEA